MKNLILVATLSAPLMAFAGNNNGPSNNNGPTNNNNSSAAQAVGVGIGVGVGRANATSKNKNVNKNTNTNVNVNANSNNNSNRNSNRNTAITGDSKSKSKSSSSSDNNVQVQGDVIKYDVAASSAAPAFASSCSVGLSGQGVAGGFGAATSSTVCDNLRMVDAYLAMAKLVDGEKQLAYVAKAMEHLENAGYVVEKTTTTGFVARIASDAAIPLGLAALLFILI